MGTKNKNDSYNFTMDIAHSPDEAWQKIACGNVDVVLSRFTPWKDAELHGDGVDFVRSLRAKGNTTPFILHTNHRRGEIERTKSIRLEDEGIAFIARFNHHDALLRKLHNALTHRVSTKQSGALIQ